MRRPARNPGSERPVGPSARRSARRACGLAAGALALAACAGPTDPLYSRDTAPVVLTTTASAGVRDLRGVYRAALCPRLPATGLPCDEVLLEVAGETSASPADPRPGASRRYRIAFVPGFLAECLDDVVRPFSDAMEDLAKKGFDVHHLTVAGRGTSEENAALLAQAIAALPPDPRPLIVIAYSKGLNDVLELIVSDPNRAASIAAVVSVAGAMNGSPLAQSLNAALRASISALPMPGCRKGDGSEFLDLRRETRLAWWQRHGAKMTKPVFALVTTPRQGRLSPILLEPYREIARIEPRNDGQLIWYDQIVPGGYLLGYVNADHWGVALPLSEALRGLGKLFRDDVPRTALIEAAIETVDGVLAAPPAPRTPPTPRR